MAKDIRIFLTLLTFYIFFSINLMNIYVLLKKCFTFKRNRKFFLLLVVESIKPLTFNIHLETYFVQ